MNTSDSVGAYHVMSRLQVRRWPSNTIVGLNVPRSSARCAGTPLGFLAYTLAAIRPIGVPIYAFTDDEAVFRQMLLPWGVEPFLMPFSDDPESTILDALAYLKRREWCDEGHWLVVITNVLAHEPALAPPAFGRRFRSSSKRACQCIS